MIYTAYMDGYTVLPAAEFCNSRGVRRQLIKTAQEAGYGNRLFKVYRINPDASESLIGQLQGRCWTDNGGKASYVADNGYLQGVYSDTDSTDDTVIGKVRRIGDSYVITVTGLVKRGRCVENEYIKIRMVE